MYSTYTTTDSITITTSGNSTTDQYQYWGTYPVYQPQYTIVSYPPQAPKKEDTHPMKQLFKVYVVTKDEDLILDGKAVVAEDENEAQFNADVAEVLKTAKLKPKDVTIICERIGQVKVRKEVQEVKVVTE